MHTYIHACHAYIHNKARRQAGAQTGGPEYLPACLPTYVILCFVPNPSLSGPLFSFTATIQEPTNRIPSCIHKKTASFTEFHDAHQNPLNKSRHIPTS